MISALARFVEELRQEGVAVSPAELIDASRALEVVGLEVRPRFKSALRSTLAKDRRQQEAFDRLFDRFFVPPARGPGLKAKERGGPGAGGSRSTGASSAGPSTKRRPHSEPRPHAPARESREGKRRNDRDGEKERERLRRLLVGLRSGTMRRSGRLRKISANRARSPSSRSCAAAEPSLVHKDLATPMPTEQERELAREIPRLVQELRLCSGRRLRRARAGRLWTRQIFRENLAHGGTPFVLPFRRRRPRQPKVILLVDVSYSVARAAGYFLLMASEFLRLGRQGRVLAFVDRAVDATPMLTRWLDGRGRAFSPGASRAPVQCPGEGVEVAGCSFARALEALAGLNLKAPSDYGRAFHGLLQSHLRPASRDTILVILGDARTNRFDPQPWALEEISRRCRAVLWLVPEPEGRWGTGDSALSAYLPFVDTVVEARDLAGLGRGLTELLRRL